MIDCPSGWKSIKRSDGGARGDEYMADQEGCGGLGSHKFCCPPDAPLPTCGWYTHNNGKCDQKCPENTIEVGSNRMYCKKNYQAACCTTNTDSMKLYNQCNWADYPVCDNGKCDSKTELTSSASGSGGAMCNLRSYRGPGSLPVVQERKYCCDTSSSDTKWDQCKWYSDIGIGPSDAREGYCRSGCPSDTVRVAMDTHIYGQCAAGGGRVQCCVPNFNTITKRDTEQVTEFRTALDKFLKDQAGYCTPESDKSSKKLRRAIHSPADSPDLTVRQVNKADTDPLLIIEEAFSDMVSENNLGLIGVWDEKVTAYFSEPSFTKLWSWLTNKEGSWFHQDYGWTNLGQSVACNLPRIQAYMANDKPFVCTCENDGCCASGDTECATGIFEKRAFLKDLNNANYSSADYLEPFPEHELERRIHPEPKRITVQIGGVEYTLVFSPMEVCGTPGPFLLPGALLFNWCDLLTTRLLIVSEQRRVGPTRSYMEPRHHRVQYRRLW